MEVKRMELLSKETRPDGVVEGKIRVIGSGGENIQLLCELRRERLFYRPTNSALAAEAIRQLRRMPEFRRTRITISKFGLPKQQLHRVITLMAEPHKIASCQVEFAGIDKADFNATFKKPEPPDDQSRRPPDRSPRRA